MLNFSLPPVGLLVNWSRLALRRLCRVRCQVVWLVWGLWAFVLLSQLLGLAGAVRAESAPLPPLASCAARVSSVSVGSGVLGLAVGLWLAGEHGRAFPWASWQVRWTVRRRRMSDLTLEEWLALLPPGVGTLAQLVDRLTRSQLVKHLAALPLLYPLLAELEVEAIIDKYCPTDAEINIGAVIVCLCLNRLVAPQPLVRVAEWASKVTLEELVGVPAHKLNSLS